MACDKRTPVVRSITALEQHLNNAGWIKVVEDKAEMRSVLRGKANKSPLGAHWVNRKTGKLLSSFLLLRTGAMLIVLYSKSGEILDITPSTVSYEEETAL